MTERDPLTGSSFALTGGSEEGGLGTVWDRAAVTRFEGRSGESPLDGEVVSATLGTDWAREPAVLGVVVSRSRGEGAYRGTLDRGEGVVESSVTKLYPWGRYAVSERVAVWGVAGDGGRALMLTSGGERPLEADLAPAMAAAGDAERRIGLRRRARW